MHGIRYAPWQIAAGLAVALWGEVGSAQSCPAPGGPTVSPIWSNGAITPGEPSAASMDGAYRSLLNAQPGSVSYLTSGTTVHALCNVAMLKADGITPCPAGAERWSRTFASTLQNFPNPAPLDFATPTHALFVAEQSGFIHGLDAETGNALPNWLSGFDTRRPSCPADQVLATPVVQLRAYSNQAFKDAYAGDVVFVITRTGCGDDSENRILALDARNPGATPLWTYAPQSDGLTMSFGSEGGSIDYDNNLIYFGTNSIGGQHTLWAIRTAPSDAMPSGTRKWSRNAGSVRNRPALRENRVYVVNFPGSLRAYRNDGTLLYTLPVSGGANVVRNPWPELRGGFSSTTYSTDAAGFLHSLLEFDYGPTSDQACGYLGPGTGVCGASGFAATNLGGVIRTMPAISPTNGKLYVGLTNGSLHQVNAATGLHESNAVMPGEVYDPTLEVEGGASYANRLMAASRMAPSVRLERFCTPFTMGGVACTTDADCSNWNHPPCSRGVCNLETSVCEELPANDGAPCNDGNSNTCQQIGPGNEECTPGCTDCDVCIDAQCVGVQHPSSSCTTLADTRNPDKNCPEGSACCSNAQGGVQCINIASDPQNCGGCGYDCGAQEPQSTICSQGVCEIP